MNPTSTTDEWLTPPDLIGELGPFDLDPCAPTVRPWPTAAAHLTVDDDGLSGAWPAAALVWLNPPYSQIEDWMRRLALHPAGGIALVFARTETRWFVDWVWEEATAVAFLHGRLFFHYVDGRRAEANCGAPSVLVAYGHVAAARLARLERPATVLPLV